jgi:hypothetical protein
LHRQYCPRPIYNIVQGVIVLKGIKSTQTDILVLFLCKWHLGIPFNDIPKCNYHIYIPYGHSYFTTSLIFAHGFIVNIIKEMIFALDNFVSGVTGMSLHFTISSIGFQKWYLHLTSLSSGHIYHQVLSWMSTKRGYLHEWIVGAVVALIVW